MCNIGGGVSHYGCSGGVDVCADMAVLGARAGLANCVCK